MTESMQTGKQIKCLVWDLDNTLWEGVLLEGGADKLREDAASIVKELDRRGIMQSIASRNEYQSAIERLKEFGLDEYFLHPQINFGSKSTSIVKIADALNINIDTFAFVDDQPFEREEVNSVHPMVMTIDAADIQSIPDMKRMHPKFLTEDASKRRLMYLEDMERTESEERFEGPQEEFLAGLNMRFTIDIACEDDLKRAVELTERTNQLNATGQTYDFDELNALRNSPSHKLLICSLEDKYGSYGRIGLALIETGDEAWTIKLLLMSCRVMSRGVGSVLLNCIIRDAMDAGKKLFADFVETGRNRMMYVTYRFAGFRESGTSADNSVLEYDSDGQRPAFPDYIEVVTDA